MLHNSLGSIEASIVGDSLHGSPKFMCSKLIMTTLLILLTCSVKYCFFVVGRRRYELIAIILDVIQLFEVQKFFLLASYLLNLESFPWIDIHVHN